jgi:hypothetical protein
MGVVARRVCGGKVSGVRVAVELFALSPRGDGLKGRCRSLMSETRDMINGLIGEQGIQRIRGREASARTHIIGPTHLLIRSSAGSHSAILVPSSPHFASPEDQIAPSPSSSTSIWLPRRSDLEGRSCPPDFDSV